MESTRRNSNRINGGGHDASLGMGVTSSMGGRLGGSKKDRWRAQAELQGILGAGERLVRLNVRDYRWQGQGQMLVKKEP